MTDPVPGATGTAPAPVLIVDDDKDLRTLLSLALRRAGLETIEASSGTEAVAIVEQLPISVVVCDLRMPGMSGLEVVRHMRSRPDTATLPFLLMTGSGDADAVIKGLEAGADDFLAKPVRLEELVARVRAHLRTHVAWASFLDSEMQARADAVRAIGQLSLSGDPEQIAEAVVSELATRTGSHHVGVFQLSMGDRLLPLARFVENVGVVRGGPPMPPERARALIARARTGPWSEPTGAPESTEVYDMFWSARPDVGAGAPLYVGGDVVGLLTLGANIPPGGSAAPTMAKLLASAIDYASVLSAVAGPAIADRRNAQAEQDRLRKLLVAGHYHSVYQPIVDLSTGNAIGHEALTRFADGTPPDVRFAEAAAAGLAVDYELATLRSAIDGARSLPADMLLSLNVSPDVLMRSGRRLARVLEGGDRKIVIEVTEHARIDDYGLFRSAVERLPGVSLAVDDAGAGYASLSHILELAPAFAKLDISLVRGLDTDPRRQGMVAGLAFFATKTGCSLIAEGVERREEADALITLGVEFAQGYLFGRPARAPDAATQAADS
jgi:EAL domain-containing protein (putative c-di-GMP-specific phosphodiesterase class I)/DNA-binding response OmpR family regulator